MKKNQSGFALGFAVLVLAAIAGGSFFIFKKLETSNRTAQGEIKNERGRVETQKILGLGGFLVSNNLILCKQGKWGNGVYNNQCKWMGQQKDKNYEPSDFGLKNLRYENDGDLVFDLVQDDKSFKYKSSISFRLIDSNSNESLKKTLGTISPEVQFIDKDHYVVMTKASVDMPDIGGRVDQVDGLGAFKRPIAIPSINIRGSSCLSQCNTSLSEHINPACRGEFTIDVDTMTDIEIVTHNEGPGVLYALDYERQVVFNNNVSNVQAPANTKASLPIDGFVPANTTIQWADRVPCATFVKNVTKRVTNRGLAGQTTSSEKVSQHSEPAGSVVYKLDAASPLSNIEPFRLNEKIVKEGDVIKGKIKETTVTIFVNPPH